MFIISIALLVLQIFLWFNGETKATNLYDICGQYNDRKFYLEFGESGSVTAKYNNNKLEAFETNKTVSLHKKCTIHFLTCPSCIVEIKFRFLNISRNCDQSTVFESCGCDYVWIYEPPFEEASGEQFCGRFLKINGSSLNYNSQTRSIAITFTYSNVYDHAFTLDYIAERNRIFFKGSPKIGNINNASQTISSPFFPYAYPIDLSVEYVINCEALVKCKISLIFADFKIAESSIVEFFDWNGQRMYVTSGNLFRPPVIFSSGPTLVMRFYANGATGSGYKAHYSFILGDLDDMSIKPDIGCGGQVSNLGGAITMMNMVQDGTKFYDCVWLIQPSGRYLHLKTHLYVKIIAFKGFVGNTELVIKQGLTSNKPSVEVLRSHLPHFLSVKEREHVIPISQGFYVSFRGYFKSESQLAISYAAFNYRDCFSGSDFLCHNLRCISILLNCDGFDHCGDGSDEMENCSEGSINLHPSWSKIPNFLFPKSDRYTDLTAATLIFLTCSFGLIAIILAMALLLYRVNLKARHQRQIQDHMETIHAILEESVGDVEEEIIIPDEPPNYEPPPDYNEVIKTEKGLTVVAKKKLNSKQNESVASSSKSCQTTPVKVPESPPPAYNSFNKEIGFIELALPGMNDLLVGNTNTEESVISRCFESIHPRMFVSDISVTLRKSLRKCKSLNLLTGARKFVSFSEENLFRNFSDSQLTNVKCPLDASNWSRTKLNKSSFQRSFSTDDITLL